MEHALDIDCCTEDGELAITLAGDLDMAATFPLESEIDRRLASGEVRRVAFDLDRVTFVDSAGVGALLATRERTKDLGIEMEIVSASEPLRRVLALTGTDDMLHR